MFKREADNISHFIRRTYEKYKHNSYNSTFRKLAFC